MIRKLLPGLLAIGLVSHAAAATVEGVVFPDRYGVDGHELVLNGAGLRTLTIFHIHAYVAGLYLQAPSRDARQILSAPGTKVVVMEFLHTGSKADVERQYRKGEEENCSHGECDPADKDDFERLIAAAPGVEPGDTFTYIVDDRGVRLLHNNKLVIDIANKDLGYRILSGFIGAHPPSPELRAALLGQPAE
jgi:long-chain acyl-CoA synthetase